MLCASAVTGFALQPRRQVGIPDIVDDRVHEEGALRPRLVQLRVHENSAYTHAQELLVEQDAVGELIDRSRLSCCLDFQNGDTR